MGTIYFSKKLLRKYSTVFLAGAVPASYWVWNFAQNRWVQSRDTMDFVYVIKRWVWSHLAAGELPLWNDQLFGGFYQLASPVIAVFTPITALFYILFDNFLAEQLQIPFFAMLAGVGTYMWARSLQLSHASSLAAAIGFGWTGTLLSLPDRSPFYFAFALYPLYAFMVVQFLKSMKNSVLYGIGTAGILSTIVLNGDWTGGAILGFALPMYAVLKGQGRGIMTKIWPLLLSVGVTAIGVWPVLENLEETTRLGGLSLAEASSFSLHPLRLLSLLAPSLWGQVYDGSFWGHNLSSGLYASRFWFHSLYVGSLLGALGLVGLYGASKKLRLTGIAALTASLGISFGQHAWIHPFLYKYFPLYSSLRYPEKFFLISVFVWSALVLRGLRFLESTKNMKPFLILAAIWNTAALLLLSIAPRTEELITNYKLSSEAAELATAHISEGFAIHCLILGAVSLLFVMRRGMHWQWALPVLVGLELIAFAPPLHWVPSSEFAAEGIFSEELRKGEHRYLIDPQFLPRQNRRQSMISNWPILEGGRDAAGYETFAPKNLFSISQNQLFKNLDIVTRVLAVEHIITTMSPRHADLKTFSDRGMLEPVAVDSKLNLALLRWKAPLKSAEFFSSYQVLEKSKPFFSALMDRGVKGGPVFLEAKPEMSDFSGNPVVGIWEKTAESPGKESYHIVVDQKAIWVLRAAYHKGWRAYIDGKETPVYRADGLSRAVIIPAGSHKLDWHFTPPIFTISATVSVLSVLIGLIVTSRAIWPLGLGVTIRS